MEPIVEPIFIENNNILYFTDVKTVCRMSFEI